MAEWTNELEDRERDIFLNRVAYNANLTVKDLPKQTKRAGSEACITNFLSTWNLTQYMRKRGKPDLKDLEYWLRCSMVSAKGSNPWVMQYGWASKQIKIKAGFSYWNGGAMDNFGMLGEDYSGGKFENSPLRHVTFPEGLRRLYYAARTGVYAFWGTPGSGHAKDYKRVYSGYGVPHAFQNAGGSDYDKGDQTSFAGWPGGQTHMGRANPITDSTSPRVAMMECLKVQSGTHGPSRRLQMTLSVHQVELMSGPVSTARVSKGDIAIG